MKNLSGEAAKTITSTFASEWVIQAKAKSALRLESSHFGVFAGVVASQLTHVSSLLDVNKEAKFDVILGDLPLGPRQATVYSGGVTITAQSSWVEVFKSLSFLGDSGSGLFLLEPLAFGQVGVTVFEALLNKNGWYLNGVFRCPESILQPDTSLVPVIGAFSRQETKNLFVAELTAVDQVRSVVQNYFNMKDSGDLISGFFMDKSAFCGFHQIKVNHQIKRLETQYREFEEHRLGEIALEINAVKTGDSFQERSNSIYIPKIGTSPVIYSLNDATIKHQNYIQVVLKEHVSNEYIAGFFRSALGRMILDSMFSQTFIPHLNKRGIEQAVVALPDIQEQNSIANTLSKINKLKEAIKTLDAELALNPTSSKTVLGQLDSMLKVIGSLTSADRVRGLVREGENKTIEFKQSLSLNIKRFVHSGEKSREQEIENSALKTVVAFLNTEGGTLLIGVSDDGSIPGISRELSFFYQKSEDKFMLYWVELLKTRVGIEYYPYIDAKIVDVGGSLVVVVDCVPSPDPCFLENDFYVRIHPASYKLSGPKMIAYVKSHFTK